MMGTQSTAESVGAVEPAVSVIIPAYGVTTMLADALLSVQAQTRTDWEAVVIDDGDARVAEHIAPFLADPRIRFVQTDNGGLSTARNRAIDQARAPLVSLLDGDDCMKPDYLAKMIAAIEASDQIGFACCDAVYFGHDRVGERFSAYIPQQAPATLARVLRREFNVYIGALVRRDALLAVGAFDTSLRSVEDLDLWIKLLEAGWQMAYVPEPLACYRRRPGQMSSNTGVMLQSALTVYERACDRLAGRPEHTIADAMCETLRKAIVAEQGLIRIREGATGEGVAMLRGSDIHRRSVRWRVAMLLIRMLPSLAGPLIRFRDRG
jgi:cellulose synthase/poly-beta-1,6-N-acetylglucosamine synthase-like glycosyltransferase